MDLQAATMDKIYKENDGTENISNVQDLERFHSPTESGEYENEPIYHEGVAREGDADHDPLPEQGTTRHLLARWQNIES